MKSIEDFRKNQHILDYLENMRVDMKKVGMSFSDETVELSADLLYKIYKRHNRLKKEGRLKASNQYITDCLAMYVMAYHEQSDFTVEVFPPIKENEDD